MSDFEAIVDKRIQQAVAYHQGSDTCVKYACIAAATVVGRYTDATQQIATKSRRSVSSVQNWANGFNLYRLLREVDCKLARRLWRELPASHWWLAHDIQRSGYNALYYLLGAFQHGWSGRAMLGEWNKDREAGIAPLVLSRAKLSFYGLALELAKNMNGLTVPQVAAVEAVRKAFAE